MLNRFFVVVIGYIVFTVTSCHRPTAGHYNKLQLIDLEVNCQGCYEITEAEELMTTFVEVLKDTLFIEQEFDRMQSLIELTNGNVTCLDFVEDHADYVLIWQFDQPLELNDTYYHRFKDDLDRYLLQLEQEDSLFGFQQISNNFIYNGEKSFIEMKYKIRYGKGEIYRTSIATNIGGKASMIQCNSITDHDFSEIRVKLRAPKNTDS